MYNNEINFYQDYNADKYIHFLPVATGEYEFVQTKRNGKNIPIKKPITENKKISFEAVKALNLDDYGQDIPTVIEDLDFTLVHSYLIDFWTAIMGSDAVLLYILLKRYCVAGRDFCAPNMKVIQTKMNKGSRTTISKNVEILEEHGFIKKIQRLNKDNDNRQVSPLFKVRQHVPLLTSHLIEQLPEMLKKEHEQLLAKTNGVGPDEKFDIEAFIQDLMKYKNIK